MMEHANRNLALTALLAAVTVNHYAVPVAGVHVKLEHVVVVLLAAGTAWAWRRGARLELAPLLWIPVFVGVTLIASTVNAPDRLASLRYTGLIALVSAGAALVYWLANTPARFHTAVRLLVALGGLEAAISLLALAAAAVGSSFGTQPGFIGTRVVYGTLWEPNVLGSYLAAAGTLALALLMSTRGRRRAAGLTAGLALILAALGLSSTRAAWLGFLVGALVVLIGTARPAGLF